MHILCMVTSGRWSSWDGIRARRAIEASLADYPRLKKAVRITTMDLTIRLRST